MKRKIISYLLVGLFTLLVGGCFVYVDALGEGGINPDLNGFSDGGGGSIVNGSKGNGINPDLDGNGGGTSADTSSTTSNSNQSSTSNSNQSSTTTNIRRKCGDACNGIKLNTCFPIVGDCIETKAGETNPTNAFPAMVRALTKIIMSVILVVCFILIIVAGIMRAADNPKGAQKLLKRVAITILLLGFSGVILKLVNPNFFS